MTNARTTSVLLTAAALALGCNTKSPEPSPVAPAASAAAIPKASASAAAAVTAPFEGEILVTVKDETANKLPASITYDVKGSRVRYVPAASPVRAIGDLDAQRVYAIDDATQSVDAIDVKAPAGAKVAPAPKVQKTGKMEKVAGLDCEDWTIDDGNEKVDVCASKGIAYIDLASNAKAGSAETAWASALTAERVFPLRVVMHDKAGKEKYRAEATKAERRKIDDASFLPPSNYKQVDLAKETKSASLP